MSTPNNDSFQVMASASVDSRSTLSITTTPSAVGTIETINELIGLFSIRAASILTTKDLDCLFAAGDLNRELRKNRLIYVAQSTLESETDILLYMDGRRTREILITIGVPFSDGLIRGLLSRYEYLWMIDSGSLPQETYPLPPGALFVGNGGMSDNQELVKTIIQPKS